MYIINMKKLVLLSNGNQEEKNEIIQMGLHEQKPHLNAETQRGSSAF